MQSNIADSPLRNTLWLVAHVRDDPMVLVQSEHPADEAFGIMKRRMQETAGTDGQIDPPVVSESIGRRYDVHDRNGWLATYWLSEQPLAKDDGMLTAIVSPGARQRSHPTIQRH